jgi:DNA-binding HxlR family transcriptional regulator
VKRRLPRDSNYGPRSTAEITLEAIRGKWKAELLTYLHEGKQRFNTIQRSFPSITQRTLTKQLRELERDGLVTRTVYPQVPPKVEYTLTDLGHSLVPILGVLEIWGENYLEQQKLSLRRKA